MKIDHPRGGLRMPFDGLQVRPNILFALSLLLAFSTHAPWSAGADFDAAKLAEIPRRMQEFVEKHEIAGAVTVVGTKDSIVRLDAVGSLNLEKNQSMPRDAMFRIASMTKPITAMAIMILADEKKLSVDDTVAKHLPEFLGQQIIAKREGETIVLKKPSRPITIRDLLTHTSGLPGGYPAGLANLYVTRDRTLAESILVSSQRPLDFEPGSKWSYCNAGIDTLGRIVEVVSGESFENFLSKRIFQPLGMKDTGFYPTSQQMERVGPVYEKQQDGTLVAAKDIIIGPTENARHPIPAGGLYSTGEDLAKLYQMTLRGGQVGQTRILSTERLEEMTRLQTGDLQCGFVPGMGFGFGFAVVREPQGITGMLSAGTYGHGGAFGTQGWIDPKRGVYVILLIQRKGLANADASDMRKVLQELVFSL